MASFNSPFVQGEIKRLVEMEATDVVRRIEVQSLPQSCGLGMLEKGQT